MGREGRQGKSGGNEVFQEIRGWKFGAGPAEFRRYRDVTGLDADSLYAEPQFVDPERRDYRLKPGTPGTDLATDGGPVGARNMPGVDIDQSTFVGVIRMPSACTKPDGMAVDPKGRLVIAAPNNDRQAPGAVFRIDAPGQAPVKWFDVPAHPETGYVQLSTSIVDSDQIVLLTRFCS